MEIVVFIKQQYPPCRPATIRIDSPWDINAVRRGQPQGDCPYATPNNALHGVSTPSDALHAAGMNARRWLLFFVRPEGTWFFALYLRLNPTVS
jgi:hypothetical protein